MSSRCTRFAPDRVFSHTRSFHDRLTIEYSHDSLTVRFCIQATPVASTFKQHIEAVKKELKPYAPQSNLLVPGTPEWDKRYSIPDSLRADVVAIDVFYRNALDKARIEKGKAQAKSVESTRTWARAMSLLQQARENSLTRKDCTVGHVVSEHS